MKILTKEEERDHYNYTLLGGSIGGALGLALGVGGVFAAGTRYPAFRQLTLPLRAFLVTSSGTFGAIITADRFSRSFEAARHPDSGYQDESARLQREEAANRTAFQSFMAFGKEYRYPIVGASWVLGMGVALGVVGRSPYLTAQQKLVQARVYAQTITIAVLCATAVFEVGDRGKGEGRWETVKIIDPDDPTHKHLIEKKVHHERYAGEDQWRDMVEAEEQKIKQREEAAHEQEKILHKQHEKKKAEQKAEKKKKEEKKDEGEKKT